MLAEPNNFALPIPDEVAAVFDNCDPRIRNELLALRGLVLKTADETDGVGVINETLRWGQPAYLTTVTGSGSTIRIGPTRAGSEYNYAMFFICHTNLVDRFATQFGETFTYDPNRALLFNVGDQHPENELRACISTALTYHLTLIGK